MSVLFRLAAAALLGAICALALKKQAPELAMMLGIASAVLLLSWVGELMEDVISFLLELCDLAGISESVASPLFKVVAIGFVTRITAELCKDAGEGGIAAAAEFAGGIAAVCAAIPLMKTVLAALERLL